jgi:hypothetical protein
VLVFAIMLCQQDLLRSRVVMLFFALSVIGGKLSGLAGSGV